MSKPLRIEFPGAMNHVTFRGYRRARIFDDDTNRLAFVDVIARTNLRGRGESHCGLFVSPGGKAKDETWPLTLLTFELTGWRGFIAPVRVE